MKKMTLDDFKNKAILKHNNKYDYSLVEYTNSYGKIKIICPDHGVFEQISNDHLCGSGCTFCNKVLTTNSFIKKAKEKHGDIYDYSLVYYTKSSEKVKIICKEHGVFEQIANVHLKGSGCSLCNGGNTLQYNEFLKRAKNKHGDIYDYSLIEYLNGTTKVKIICKKHGVFEQIPCDHAKGCGCPHCRSSKGEQQVKEWLNNNSIKFIQEYKFDDCKNKNKLPFDFYIPSINTCIEFDGRQHYIQHNRSKDINKNNETFKLVQSNDKIKTEYCINNNIDLIRIPYFDINNISKHLNVLLG